MLEGKRDSQTVTPAGERIEQRIDGVVVRPTPLQVDERGELCEIFDPRWGIATGPLVYVYQTSVRPGKIKGWVYHLEQDDRLFVSVEALKIVLFDMRATSPTRGLINEIFLSERNRALLFIPHGVVHAVQNMGDRDAIFINLPTRPYQHGEPDKYRLPLDCAEIPYVFESGDGW